LDCDVYIRYRKQRAFPARAENCSLYGMYLKTESLTLLTGALVELDIFYQDRNWQIMGLVTHTRKHGLGVMFWEEQPEFYRTVAATASVLPDERALEMFSIQSRTPFAGDAAP
jgi:hypothetical protein